MVKATGGNAAWRALSDEPRPFPASWSWTGRRGATAAAETETETKSPFAKRGVKVALARRIMEQTGCSYAGAINRVKRFLKGKIAEENLWEARGARWGGYRRKAQTEALES